MKPTEQAAREAAKQIACKIIPLSELESQIHHQLAYNGIQWAISQMQPEWVAVEDELPGDETYAIIWRKGYSPEQTVARQVFNMTHACYCFIDNSLNTYQIGEVVTHWSPMLEPPTK